MNRNIEDQHLALIKPQIYYFQEKLSQMIKGKSEPLSFKGVKLLNLAGQIGYNIESWNLLKKSTQADAVEGSFPFLFTRDIKNHLSQGRKFLGKHRPELSVDDIDIALKKYHPANPRGSKTLLPPDRKTTTQCALFAL